MKVRLSRRDLALLGGSVAVGLVLVAGVTVAATRGEPEEPKREITDKAPPEEQEPPVKAFDSDAYYTSPTPTVYADAFLLYPAGGDSPPRGNSFGDERDSWKWERGTAESLAELPIDPDVVRVPPPLEGFLSPEEFSFIVGTSADGTQFQLSELGFTYDHRTWHSISVTVWRPLELAVGKPYPVTVPRDEPGYTGELGYAIETLMIAGRPAVYSHVAATSDASGSQTLLVADGEIMIALETYRGHTYETLEAIAKLLLEEGAR